MYMSKKLKVFKTEDGELKVKCPRCDELVTPIETIFDGMDCEECGQPISDYELSNYLKAVKEKEDNEDFE